MQGYAIWGGWGGAGMVLVLYVCGSVGWDVWGEVCDCVMIEHKYCVILLIKQCRPWLPLNLIIHCYSVG